MELLNGYEEDAFSRALYAARASFKTDDDIHIWIKHHLHLIPNMPQHLPEQRRVEIDLDQWFFNTANVACDNTTLELRITIQCAAGTNNSVEPYKYAKRYNQSFGDWPHLTAMAIATHVTTNERYDEPSYMSIVDRTIEKYQPLHFPMISLKYLHELRLAGLICQSDYIRHNTLEVATLIFDTSNRKITGELPDDFHSQGLV